MLNFKTLIAILFVCSACINAAWLPTMQLPFNRDDPTFVDNADLLFFAGGDQSGVSSKLNILNLTSGVWRNNMVLSVARKSLASASLQNKVYFAGGSTGLSSRTGTVDIYDVVADEWKQASLKAPRSSLTAAVVGDTILFAGGIDSNGQETNAVDIYHSKNDSWTTASLTQRRSALSVAVIGSRAMFAGGFPLGYSDTVEIYDAETGRWSQDTLSLKRTFLSAIGFGDMAFFVGGSSPNGVTDRVDIFNGANNTWSRAKLSIPRVYVAAGVAGDRVLFATGWANDIDRYVDTVDIYVASTNSWEVTSAPKKTGEWVAVSTNDRIYFYDSTYSTIDIWRNGSDSSTPVFDPFAPNYGIPTNHSLNSTNPNSRFSAGARYHLNSLIMVAIAISLFIA